VTQQTNKDKGAYWLSGFSIILSLAAIIVAMKKNNFSG